MRALMKHRKIRFNSNEWHQRLYVCNREFYGSRYDKRRVKRFERKHVSNATQTAYDNGCADFLFGRYNNIYPAGIRRREYDRGYRGGC